MILENGKIAKEFNGFKLTKNGVEKNNKVLNLDESLYILYEHGCHIIDSVEIEPIGLISFKRLDNEVLNRIDNLTLKNKTKDISINVDLSSSGISEKVNPHQFELRRNYKINKIISVKRPLVIYLCHDYAMVDDIFMKKEIDMLERYISKLDIPVIYVTDDIEFSSKLTNSVVKNDCSY